MQQAVLSVQSLLKPKPKSHLQRPHGLIKTVNTAYFIRLFWLLTAHPAFSHHARRIGSSPPPSSLPKYAFASGLFASMLIASLHLKAQDGLHVPSLRRPVQIILYVADSPFQKFYGSITALINHVAARRTFAPEDALTPPLSGIPPCSTSSHT